MDDLLEARIHEIRGVVHQGIVEIVRKPLGEPFHGGLDGLGHGHRIGAGREIDPDGGRIPSVQAAEGVRLARTELDTPDIRDQHGGAVRVGPHHDALELSRIAQTPAGLERDLELLVGRHGLRADPPDRGLDVLALDRRNHVRGGQRERGQAIHVEPDPHAVVQRPEQRRLSHTGHARQGIDDIDGRVITQEQPVVGPLRRTQRHDLQHGVGLLLDRQTLPLHLLRELGHRQIGAVLHIDRVDVRIRAEREGDGERIAAVVAAGGLHVEHVVHAVDLRLDRLSDGRLHHRCARAWIGRADRHLRRDDVGKLGDRDAGDGDQPGERDDDRDDDREPRPVDEDVGDHCSSAPAALVAGAALTA